MTTNYFARHIGLPRGENLYQIKRGNNGISLDVASRIVEKFPEIDRLWLLTGEGQMFRQADRGVELVPFYGEEVESALARVEELSPSSEMLLPQAGDCDFAMFCNSPAMAPSIPPGTIVVLKKVDTDAIIPGFEYAIMTQKIVTLRIVRRGIEAGTLRLVAADSANYDDIVVKTNDITGAYRVKCKIIVNN